MVCGGNLFSKSQWQFDKELILLGLERAKRVLRGLSEKKSECERPGPARPMPTLLRGCYLRDCGFDFHTVFTGVWVQATLITVGSGLLGEGGGEGHPGRWRVPREGCQNWPLSYNLTRNGSDDFNQIWCVLRDQVVMHITQVMGEVHDLPPHPSPYLGNGWTDRAEI